jgi:hypothetical protein
VQRSAASDKQIYSARELFVPVDAATGWEAAVYDHFHALVQTICVKLHASDDGVDRRMVGGSTYSFEVWPGHPFEEEVLSQLETFRTRTSELRARVREYNDQQGRPAVRLSVTFYAGQCVVPHEEETNAPKHA